MTQLKFSINKGRAILRFPDYDIFPDGKVWSKPRLNSINSWRKGRFLKSATHKSGHKCVYLSLNGKLFKRYVHRLVLEAFAGPCPNGKEGCHYDGNPANNELTNLRWATRKENAEDTIRHGTTLRGERNKRAKLNSVQVRSIRRLLNSNVLSLQEIARLFNVARSTISQIKRGYRWGWLTGVQSNRDL